jgi:YNFM family putative membrane transporter
MTPRGIPQPPRRPGARPSARRRAPASHYLVHVASPSPVPHSIPPHDTRIRHGTAEFRRTTLAMFSAGFATFALLYCVQPLMPVFARTFQVSAAQSSLSLSLTTGLLAPSMIVAGVLSEARGRKPMMVGSLLASSVLMLLCAVAPRWGMLLALRALAGIAFAGLPAISMAYLSEEMHPTSIGLSMGLFIGGNGLGGMLGRLAVSYVAEVLSWRYALAMVGLLGVAATAIFWRTLPPSRHFTPRPTSMSNLLTTFRQQLGDRRIFASAWIGSLADRVGRGRMLLLMTGVMFAGVALTLARPLPFIVLGIATVTFGFFGGHSVASSWVGLRAHWAKAQAAALYLFCYYVGSSVAGSVGGVFWDRFGWPGVTSFIAAMLVVALVMATIAARDPASATSA